MRIITGTKGAHCLYPFQIDPYYNGCAHKCLYCYAASISNSFGLSFNKYTPTDVGLLRKRLSKPSGRMGEFIKRKHPLRIGGMSDPFMRGIDHRTTIEVLDILNDYAYPYMIFTKSADIVNYIKHIDADLAQVQISVSTKYESILEPYASTNAERFAACEILVDSDINVIGRIAPIIPMWADGAEDFENFENITCDAFDFTIPEKFSDSGVAGLITEMIRLTPWMMKNLRGAGINIDNTINDRCIRKNGTIYYSLDTRRKYYEALDYTGLPLTYCDVDLWNPSIDGDCCQFAKANEVI